MREFIATRVFRPPLLINAHHLTYQYGEGELSQVVLKEASLKLHAGEFVILAGPSGSGKSTLLSLIGALRSPQKGSLSVVGTDMVSASEETMLHVRKQIGYVFQQHNLLKFLTAIQNVEMALEMFPGCDERQRRELSISALKEVSLEKYANHYPSQLSVGQKQRVAIARSIVHAPALILADEPTASLDGKTGVKVVETLHNMVKTLGGGALVVTHDSRIFEYADRILHIEDGVLHA